MVSSLCITYSVPEVLAFKSPLFLAHSHSDHSMLVLFSQMIRIWLFCASRTSCFSVLKLLTWLHSEDKQQFLDTTAFVCKNIFYWIWAAFENHTFFNVTCQEWEQHLGCRPSDIIAEEWNYFPIYLKNPGCYIMFRKGNLHCLSLVCTLLIIYIS